MLPSAWVIDSNCFIHMGRYGGEHLGKDLVSVLRKMPASLHVTPEVHSEVATVRMYRWQDKPRLLDAFGNLLTTTTIEEAQVRGLAERIGEKASPQDVAHPPEEIRDMHNIRGLVAVEKPESLCLEVISEVT